MLPLEPALLPMAEEADVPATEEMRPSDWGHEALVRAVERVSSSRLREAQAGTWQLSPGEAVRGQGSRPLARQD